MSSIRQILVLLSGTKNGTKKGRQLWSLGIATFVLDELGAVGAHLGCQWSVKTSLQ